MEYMDTVVNWPFEVTKNEFVSTSSLVLSIVLTYSYFSLKGRRSRQSSERVSQNRRMVILLTKRWQDTSLPLHTQVCKVSAGCMHLHWLITPTRWIGYCTQSPHTVLGFLSAHVFCLQSVSTLQTFFLAMLLYPEVQRKVQEQIDQVVGRDRLPEFSDLESLPYLRAIFRELIRWQPVLPLGMF